MGSFRRGRVHDFLVNIILLMRLDFLADARKPCVPPNASASAAPRLGDPEVVVEIVAGIAG